MTKKYYLCGQIGDGLSPESAFRPALEPYIKEASGSWVGNTDGNDWIILVEASEDAHVNFAKVATIIGPDTKNKVDKKFGLTAKEDTEYKIAEKIAATMVPSLDLTKVKI